MTEGTFIVFVHLICDVRSLCFQNAASTAASSVSKLPNGEMPASSSTLQLDWIVWRKLHSTPGENRSLLGCARKVTTSLSTAPAQNDLR